MCPDRDLISAFVDGEVPSPWRERIEEHLASCGDCASLASGYAALGERLRADPLADEAAALARGRARLDALLDRLSAGGDSETSAIDGKVFVVSRKAWRRSVSLPLPLAAAAAILVLLLGGATTLLALRPGKGGAAIQAVASGEIAPPASQPRAQAASMDQLLRYLDAQGGQVTLTIKLPDETTFGSAGKPVIMRSGQVVKGMPVGGSSP